MELASDQIKGLFAACGQKIAENRDRLIELDSVAGDGDLGLSMSDGFNAVDKALRESDETDIGKLLYLVSKTMSAYAPSSAGTLLSAGLMNSAKVLRGKTDLDVAGLALWWGEVLAGIVALGGAKPGDKTMLDSLVPAVESLKAQPLGQSPAKALRAAAEAAQKGAQCTVGMMARHGRAAVRGEESRSMIDPGAVLCGLLFEAMAEYAESL